MVDSKTNPPPLPKLLLFPFAYLFRATHIGGLTLHLLMAVFYPYRLVFKHAMKDVPCTMPIRILHFPFSYFIITHCCLKNPTLLTEMRNDNNNITFQNLQLKFHICSAFFFFAGSLLLPPSSYHKKEGRRTAHYISLIHKLTKYNKISAPSINAIIFGGLVFFFHFLARKIVQR